MKRDPFYLTLLEKLGFNTTKLRWRLYRMQQRSERISEDGLLPSWLRWVRYPHKICRHCGAVNDREARICHRCDRKLPSVWGYRITRALGMMAPEGRPVVANGFVVAIAAIYVIMLFQVGFGHIMSFPESVMRIWGGWASYHQVDLRDAWRIFGFGLVHGGLLHIGFNGYASSQIGPALEAQVGPRRMLILITLTQFTSWLGTYLWYVEVLQQPVFTVGASGWLFGLIGFGIAHFGRPGSPAPHLRGFLIQWAIIAFVFGLFVGANNAAHAGGFIGGFLFGNLPEPRSREARARAETAWKAAAWACAVIWAVTLVQIGVSVATNFDQLTQG